MQSFWAGRSAPQGTLFTIREFWKKPYAVNLRHVRFKREVSVASLLPFLAGAAVRRANLTMELESPASQLFSGNFHLYNVIITAHAVSMIFLYVVG